MTAGFGSLKSWALVAIVALGATGLSSLPALALKAISVTPEQDRVEISSLGEFYDSRGDSLQLEMASASDAASGRMTVRAITPGTNPAWIAFALQNATDKPIERWLTAERYTMFGSGAIWPDLDARRLEAVTPSLGFIPERIKNDRADIFRITLEPGQTITYVAELSTERFARVYLWKPLDYELKARDRQLMNGVLLGLTGLLAIFLTAVFAANHKAIFPAAALVAWCVLAHLLVDFGFFHKLFQLRPEDNAVYRAATESATAASFVIFLHTFLRLGQSPSLIRMLLGLWMTGQLVLVAIAVIDPRLAATFARLSFLAVGGVGALIITFMALRGRDRALALIPLWMLFLVWVFGAAVIATGRLATDIAVSGLISGLVLLVLVIGFTVTQFAFRSQEPLYGSAAPSDQQRSALAVDGAGAAIFEWQPKRGDVSCSSVIEGQLGLQAGELSAKLSDFLKHVHEADRERLRMVLGSVQDRAGAAIRTEFRLRHADNSARWFELDASSVKGADPRSLRFVGLLREITDTKRAHERLVQDAVTCSLTGLPNRALFLDRLGVVMARAKSEEALRPAIILIDIDKFKSINATFGLPVGDSLLLTIARRLQRHITGHETLARVGGDQFAILIEAEKEPADFARDAERIRRAVRAPIKIGGKDIVMTASIGIAIFDGDEEGQAGLLEDAGIATYRAKRAGADRIDLFRPDMRSDREDRRQIEADLRRAIDQNQLRVLYQPVIYLPTEELAGFEASVSWLHPKLGQINPLHYVPAGGDSQLIAKVGRYVLTRAAQDAARWQKELPRIERPLFVAVNITARELFRPELARDVRQLLDHGVIPKGTLRLELAESLVMENPEQSSEILELLRGVGADLSLDEFGAGYSSLSYLQRFPFDTIKIDRWFVQASAGGEGAGASMVRSMVALAHELNKKVVADGVEDPEDAAFLRGIGCAYAQGFYYGDPMPDREVLQLLKLVRKSEHKLQPRGFFRMTMKRTKEKSTVAAEVGVQAAVADGDRLQSAAVEVAKANKVKRSAAKPGRTKANGRIKPHASASASAPANEATPPSLELEFNDATPGQYAENGLGRTDQTEQIYDQIGGVEPDRVAASGLGYDAQALYREPYSHLTELPPPIDPLSSLQAGLNALNGRVHQSPPPPVVEPTTNASFPSPHQRDAGQFSEGVPNYANDLVALFQATPAAERPVEADQLAKLVPVGRRPDVPSPPFAPIQRTPRPEPIVRTRPARLAPDLSKLPPGLAASLAKLAGSPPVEPAMIGTVPPTQKPDRG